jgi:DNA polymerase-3 subunit alpha
MMFFGNDYLEYNKYFTIGFALYFKGKVQTRSYGDNNELEIKLKSIDMLSNVRKEMVKSISIILPVQLITDGLITDIKSLTDNTRGKVELKFKIIDVSENLSVDLSSRNQRIDLSDDFMSYLQRHEELNFKFN